MLFPNLGPSYYDEKDQDILNRMQIFYDEAISINQSFWQEADTDTRFYLGDQTIWNNYYNNMPLDQRKQFSFNRIKRVVDMISGQQRKNRRSTTCIPVENGDSKTADQLTKVIMWCNQQEEILENISDCFEGSLITGMTLLNVWLDYRNDPISGNIRIDVCPYNSFLIDPYFRKPDLSDCNTIWKRSFLTKQECLSLFPDKTEEIVGLSGLDTGTGRDGKFQFMPESYNYGIKNLLTYDEFYYRSYRRQTMLCDSESGEVTEWKSDDKDKLEQFLRLYPTIIAKEQDIPTVKLAIVIQGKVFYDGGQPNGLDLYPFVPFYASYHPESPYFSLRLKGIVRDLRDAQFLYNRRRIIELDILESQVNSGMIYKANALVNPDDVFMSGQGRGIAIKGDGPIGDAVQQIIPPQIPPSMIQLSELLAREVMEISGVNEELLGANNEDLAGLVSMMRQRAGLVTLEGLFDRLDRSQKILGKLILELIQTNFAPGKILRILGEEPTQEFYNKNFGRYDIAIEDGLNTSTQRQMQFAQLLQLKEIGVPISANDLLEASTIQGKDKIIANSVRQEQMAMQLQQMQMQVEMQRLQAETEALKARAKADTGLGLERISRIQENQSLAVEREAAAHRDEEAALLNLVKALKEIESVDVENLTKLINVAMLVKNQEEMTHAKATMEQGVIQQGANNESQALQSGSAV